MSIKYNGKDYEETYWKEGVITLKPVEEINAKEGQRFWFITTGGKIKEAKWEANTPYYRQLKNATPIGLDKKLSAKLWKFSESFGYNCYDKNLACKNKEDNCKIWTQVNKNISVTFLAEMLGSTRESISREMKKLENCGLIKWENKKLLVNREALKDYYKQ